MLLVLLGNGEDMNHEFLNGDALNEILVDESIELFIMHPPYMGMDLERYSRPEKQINNVKNRKTFVKRLVKVTQNAEKALKPHGSILMLLPAQDAYLLADYLSTVAKKVKMMHVVTMIWSYNDKENANSINPSYAYVVHLSKGMPRHDKEYINKHLTSILEFKSDPEELEKVYGSLAHVSDAMPLELAEHLIQMFSLEGDTVADLFGGTGTISLAAETTGRNSVYNDISEVQLKLAKKRLADFTSAKKRQKA